MAAELRWILLALSLVLLGGIWWWGRRRSSQAPGNATLRETTPTLDPVRPPPPAVETAPEPSAREWGVPPFEPLSIRTQEYERVPVLSEPMMVDPQVISVPRTSPAMPAAGHAPIAAAAGIPDTAATDTTAAPEVTAATAATEVRTAGTGAGSPPAPAANSSERQKIVTVRVCAAGEARWSGASLLSALELHGLAYGRYRVFHRRHVDGRSLFCVASMVEPGTFDVTQMSSEEFRGITLFAVLPGPVEPLLTVDELLGAARGLAQELAGMVQDSKGMPLSPQRAAALRDDVARFQASLHQG
jgi:cell division protein ZipA